jgi:hypothetical protein
VTGVEPARLFKYVTIDTLTRTLTSGIRFTQPGAFNDPFELLPEICVPIDQAERNISISFDIAARRRTPPVGEVGENVEGYNCCDMTSRHILRELNRSIGILCLSRDGRAEDIHAFIARLAAEAETIAPRGRGVSLTAARRRKRVVPTSRGTP